MKPADVYSLLPITPVKASGAVIEDENGETYLDFYGGHAVISIGHSHPVFVKKISDQLSKLAFYSNSVQIPLQQELAEKLGKMSGYENYSLFLCNSGAEANENAMKTACFHNGKKKIIAFEGSFHGRTSLAMACTDDPALWSEQNKEHSIVFLPLNDLHAVQLELEKGNAGAIIIEGIQGYGGVNEVDAEFLKGLSALCRIYNCLLILDEVQSGYGRSGKFFAHQYAGIQPDLITIAKGMGNGFPVAGVLISPEIQLKKGQLGTTFGGNHLACAAAIAVLDVMEKEQLIENAHQTGNYLIRELGKIDGIKKVKGKGLMIGIEMNEPIETLRNELLHQHHVFTGNSKKKNVFRILPPLSISKEQADQFLNALHVSISKLKQHETLSVGK